jgi:hypothetical protein
LLFGATGEVSKASRGKNNVEHQQSKTFGQYQVHGLINHHSLESWSLALQVAAKRGGKDDVSWNNCSWLHPTAHGSREWTLFSIERWVYFSHHTGKAIYCDTLNLGIEERRSRQAGGCPTRLIDIVLPCGIGIPLVSVVYKYAHTSCMSYTVRRAGTCSLFYKYLPTFSTFPELPHD